MAPSKVFKLPPIDYTPPEDVEQVLKLRWQYTDRVAAVSLYIKNNENVVSKLEQKSQVNEDLDLIKLNEEINAKVAQKRKERLEKEHAEEEIKIKAEVEEFQKKAIRQQREMENVIKQETIALENRIRLEDLESAIEKALDNPVDYEFAIDNDGHIYHGRYTKSVMVSPEEREKIPRPLKDHEKVLKTMSGKE